MRSIFLLCLFASSFVQLQAQTDKVPPTISLLGANPDTIAVFEQFVDPGYTASDDTDGKLTDSVEISTWLDSSLLGAYLIQYSVSDQANNTTTAERKVVVVDTIPPEVELMGDSLVQLPLNAQYLDPGVAVTDNYNSAAELTIVITSNFTDTSSSVPGCYFICYEVVDNSGNRTMSTTRIIEVENGCTTYDFATCASSGRVGFSEPETEKPSAFEVYPNPVAETLYIRNNGQNGAFQARLVNPLGQQVEQIQVKPNSKIGIPVRHLPAGIYFLILDAHQEHIKVLISR